MPSCAAGKKLQIEDKASGEVRRAGPEIGFRRGYPAGIRRAERGFGLSACQIKVKVYSSRRQKSHMQRQCLCGVVILVELGEASSVAPRLRIRPDPSCQPICHRQAQPLRLITRWLCNMQHSRREPHRQARRSDKLHVAWSPARGMFCRRKAARRGIFFYISIIRCITRFGK